MSDTPLQFDTVVDTAPAACVLCNAPLTTEYYTVNGQVACPSCQAGLTETMAVRPGVRGLLSGAVRGSIPGALGAVLWWAIRRYGSLEIGLIAIGIGHFVGLGVRAGSGGRGGRGFQVLAVVVTYFWITANYVPDILQAFAAGSAASTTADAGVDPSARATATPAAFSSDPAAAEPSAANLLVATVFLFGIALAAPFLQGIENAIGILIIGFGLYQAWRINAPGHLDVAGPFALRATPSPATTPEPPQVSSIPSV